jgi:hypothetical protein
MKKILLKLLQPLVVKLVKEEMEKQTVSIAKDIMKLNDSVFEEHFLKVLNSASGPVQ